MESIDLWFAELKDDDREFLNIEPDFLEAPAFSSPTIQTSQKHLDSAVVDRDLARVKAEYEGRDRSISPVKLASQGQMLSVLSTPTIQTAEKNLDAGVCDGDLARIKIEYEQRDRAARVVTQEPRSEQIVPQELQVLTRREKVRQAQVWLKKLDKNSDERFWFDRFALKYDCRVEAAIEYLQVVKEI